MVSLEAEGSAAIVGGDFDLLRGILDWCQGDRGGLGGGACRHKEGGCGEGSVDAYEDFEEAGGRGAESVGKVFRQTICSVTLMHCNLTVEDGREEDVPK